MRENNIKIDVKIVFRVLDSINWTRSKCQFRALVNAVMNLRVS
jgi:hypothetical protein